MLIVIELCGLASRLSTLATNLASFDEYVKRRDEAEQIELEKWKAKLDWHSENPKFWDGQTRF